MKAYRPISLMSAFYKIISNVLTTQLKGTLLKNLIIPKEMIAYLPNCSGQEGMRLLTDVCDNAMHCKKSLYNLQSYLETAYDKIKIEYLTLFIPGGD